MIINISVIIPARNEEHTLSATLRQLKNQTIEPNEIIIINDNSTDRTKSIGNDFGCTIIDYDIPHENWTEFPNLAVIKNKGLKKISKDYDYIMILGADHILPNNYIELLIKEMEINTNLAVTSGVIKNEWSVVPRGSGRIIKKNFFEKIGRKYPVNYGYEGYLLFKALSLGYEIKSFPEIITTTQRKTSNNYNLKSFYYRGKSMKALGYVYPYIIGRILVTMKRNGIKSGIQMLKGFHSNHISLYEEELREYVRDTHRFSYHHIIRFIQYFKFLISLKDD